MQKNERFSPFLLRDVAAMYEARQFENNAEETRRREEAIRADSKIEKLLQDRVNLFRAYADAAFSDPVNAESIAKALQKKITKLQSDLRARLMNAGFAETFLQPVYRCAKCRDTGYVGEPVRERCTCYYEYLHRQIALETDHGLNLSENFAAYKETVFPDTPLQNGVDIPAQEKICGDTQRRYTARIRDYCAGYIKDYPNNTRKNMLLLGHSGLGKTFLMNCIGNAAIDKGVFAVKLTAYQLTARMQAMVFDRTPEPMALLMEAPLLLLDDLGVEPIIPNITIEQLFALLNERELHGLHTVISSNMQPDELTRRYTERITSRLFDRRTTATYVFQGKDVRHRV